MALSVAGRLRVGVVLGCLGFGCAAAPPGPRGPLSEAGAQFALDWSVAVGKARLARPGKPLHKGTADYYGLNFPIPPRRLEGRLAPVSWADLGADIGWLDGGVDVRFGVPAAAGRFFPGNLALGMRSGRPGPIHETKGTHSFWGRLEAYPLLRESSEGSQRAVVALGLNGGVFYHQMSVATGSDDNDEGGLGFDDGTSIFRRELRLEAAIGYFMKPPATAALLLAVEPYWVVHGNDGSGGPPGTTFHEAWGVVFVLSGSFFLRAHQPRAKVVMPSAPAPAP
jgi:hypothetical protein